MRSTSRARRKKLTIVVTLFAFVFLLIRFNVVEYWRTYKLEKNTPVEIQEIAKKSGMSTKGKYFFYGASPRILNLKEFSRHCYGEDRPLEDLSRGCSKAGKSIDILGYDFVLFDPQIYLRDLKNPDYADAIHDTAAHEMLHIAYDRLSSEEEARVVKLLKMELEILGNDARLSLYLDDNRELDIISYEELYAVLGSYYGNLSPELESHFNRYFSDRDRLIKISSSGKYRSMLDEAAELKQEWENLQKNLTNLNEQLYSNNTLSAKERVSLQKEYQDIIERMNNVNSNHEEITAKLDETK